MGFQDEMKQMFLRIAAGDVEPEEWETWWNSNRPKLEETLTRGDRGRIMPALWSANYYWMTKTPVSGAVFFTCEAEAHADLCVPYPGAPGEDVRLLCGKSAGRGEP